jgi:two-component sensor histidine kinase
MNAAMIDADGVKLELEGYTNGDVKLTIDDGEPIELSKTTAQVLGLALTAVATKENPEE